MAKMEIKLPEEFLLKISNLAEKTDEIVPKVLEVGGEVVLDKVRSNLQTVIGKDTKYESRSTGELLSALGLTEARLDRNSNYNVKIGFAEPRREGSSNAKIASVIEYGKHGQPPKPFMQPAKASSRKDCIEAMKAKFEDEVSKL